MERKLVPNMATVNPTINDTMTQVQLRQIRQRLNEERRLRTDRNSNTPRVAMDEQNIRLQQAMLKRQELMDRIKHEQTLNDDLTHRPATYSARRKNRSPLPTPRRAESQPPLRGATTPRQVIEHQFRPMRLDPIEQPPQHANPHIIHAPATVPTPYLLNVGATNPTSSKGEMMEMMMMQNAQMHQMIMNQMMMSSIPKPSPAPDTNQSPSRVVDIDEVLNRRRPPSVHHHHYDPGRQSVQQPHVQQPVYTLPPVQLPPTGYQNYPSPRYYPTEVEPLRQPRVHRKKIVRKKTHQPVEPRPIPSKPNKPQKPQKVDYTLPFPGPWPLRRFRHVAYAVFFEKVLEKLLRKKKKRFQPLSGPKSLSPDFIFGIKLKEVIAALHTVYLNPSNKIGSLLRQYTAESSRDLVESVNSSKTGDKKNAYEDLSYVVENMFFELTDIMPNTGVLGSHRKAVVVDMCRNGRLYPKGYLWQVEKDMLNLDPAGRTRNVRETEAFMLVFGIYLARGIVTTLLIKPVEYGLMVDPPGPVGEKNLKMLASVFVYIYRKMLVLPNEEPVPIPFEISRFLYPDEEMKEVYKKIKDSFDYAENLVQQWGKEYVGRIRQVVTEIENDEK